ncbi:Uncharacterised protein [Mycobacteroides abscessus subsp. abscessus]|nr:Uncharacterised protein [Mycobacteroides abscessus subsp. abscessus]
MRTRSTSERITRAKFATSETPTAIATFAVPKPSAVTRASESSSAGMDSSTSTTRIVTASTTPPSAPASRPSSAPATRAIATAETVAVSESPAPCTTRV